MATVHRLQGEVKAYRKVTTMVRQMLSELDEELKGAVNNV